MRLRTVLVLCAALVLVLGVGPAMGGGTPAIAFSAAAGTLTFDAQLDARYPPTTCPDGTPGGIECFARTGSGTVRGLGAVNESFVYLVDPAPTGCGTDIEPVRVLPTTARLSVPGKGEIQLSVGESGCASRGGVLRATSAFTITGGTGAYTGASGGGTYTDNSYGPPTYRGKDRWQGTLSVPGLDFDVTPPVLRGAVARTVRAPRRSQRVRVPFKVTAVDAVDGAVPATCMPRPGSIFRLGRTRVTCSATDKSANAATRTFTVTVLTAR
jgi:HYR domain